MDQGANPTSILHVLIPVPIRFNLSALFHDFGNRLVLSHVSLLYEHRYGQPLNVQQCGCLNMNQFFNSMKHLFYFHQVDDTTYVNCFIASDSIKLIKEPGKTRLKLDSLDNIWFCFDPHDFSCIRSILFKALEANKPIRIAQFEQDFISLVGFAFNYLKYGFKSTSDFFISFSDLFEFKDVPAQCTKSPNSYSVKNSLGESLIMLKLPRS